LFHIQILRFPKNTPTLGHIDHAKSEGKLLPNSPQQNLMLSVSSWVLNREFKFQNICQALHHKF